MDVCRGKVVRRNELEVQVGRRLTLPQPSQSPPAPSSSPDSPYIPQRTTKQKQAQIRRAMRVRSIPVHKLDDPPISAPANENFAHRKLPPLAPHIYSNYKEMKHLGPILSPRFLLQALHCRQVQREELQLQLERCFRRTCQC